MDAGLGVAVLALEDRVSEAPGEKRIAYLIDIAFHFAIFLAQ